MVRSTGQLVFSGRGGKVRVHRGLVLRRKGVRQQRGRPAPSIDSSTESKGELGVHHLPQGAHTNTYHASLMCALRSYLHARRFSFFPSFFLLFRFFALDFVLACCVFVIHFFLFFLVNYRCFRFVYFRFVYFRFVSVVFILVALLICFFVCRFV